MLAGMTRRDDAGDLHWLNIRMASEAWAGANKTTLDRLTIELNLYALVRNL